MSDLERRLRDVLPEDDALAAAIRSADRDEPGPAAKAALLGALGLGAVTAGAAATAAATAGATISTAPPALPAAVATGGAATAGTGAAAGGATVAAKAGLTLAIVKWVGVSAIVVTGSVAAVQAVRHDDTPPPSAVNATPATAPARATAPTTTGTTTEASPATAVPPPAPTETTVTAEKAAPSPPPTPTSIPTSLPTSTSTPTSNAIATPIATQPPASTSTSTPIAPTAPAPTELDSLDRARSSLRAGRAQEALVALDAYARSFPRGVMSEEADALRVEALVRAGQRANAERLGRAFLAEHPRSPQAPRVRALVGDGP